MDSLRSILVHLDGGAASARRLALAQRVAASRGAALRALCSVSPVPQALADRHRQHARRCFEHAAAAGGSQASLHWESPTDEPPAPAFIRQALHADLLVLGQHDPQDLHTSTVPRDFVAQVLLGSGTPALVQPLRGREPERLGVVLVAWRPGREAAHALAAALPLLKQAAQVHLLTWSNDDAEARQDQAAVVRHLALHGIARVEPHRGRLPGDSGIALLAMATALHADLLVMGCYGHSPLHELVLGGATRTVLRDAQLPVLMAS
jgi:nucleotide-binding universal stress UspA family protein